MKNLNYLIVFIAFFSLSATAQKTGSVRGFVYEEESGNPVIFTNVYLEGTTYGTSTDVNGYYSITKVPVGKYTLVSYSLGFDTVKIPVEIRYNEIATQKIILKKSSIELEVFEVTAEAQEMRTEVKMSQIKVTSKEIKALPSVGGESDIAQYLQVLPGIVFTGDQGGQLYIRGGSPVQNRVFLDGMVIYNPFHSIGLYSVFETDIIRNADVSAGGFNSKYGDAISSVIDITTRDGNPNRIAGKLSASTFGAKAILEGPFKKPKEAGGSYISWLLNAKTSYLNKTSPSLYPYIENPEGLPYSFLDFYGKIAFHGNKGSQFNIFGFSHNDKVDYSISKLNWKAFGGGANFILVPTGSSMLVEGDFSYSQYKVDQQDAERDRSSTINNFNLGLDFSYMNNDDKLLYGVDITGFSTDFQYINALNRKINEQQNTTQMAVYVDYKLVAGKWVVDPSLRAIYYASLNEFSFEPRLGVKFNATNRFRIKGAAGLYSQNLISSNSDRDVVNLFNGYLSSPGSLQTEVRTKDGGTREVKTKLQKAVHYIIGFEVDILKNLSLNLEGYYKDYLQLISINRYKIFDDNSSNADVPDILKKDFIVEDGYAYGGDLTLKYNYKNIYVWVAYSYSMTKRWDGVVDYYPVFDRRHNLNLVGSYTFGKDLNWQISVRFNYGSGFPFTQTEGYYEQFDFVTDGLNTDYTTANGTLGVEYGELNQGRLPDYARFDIDASRIFALGQYSELEISIGVTNILNRDNIFYFDPIKYERVNQLPILPSLAVSISF